MMKKGLSVKLNKKYYFAALIMFGLQLALGINLANAKPCQDEIKNIAR